MFFDGNGRTFSYFEFFSKKPLKMEKLLKKPNSFIPVNNGTSLQSVHAVSGVIEPGVVPTLGINGANC